jgi:hypothetical protein
MYGSVAFLCKACAFASVPGPILRFLQQLTELCTVVVDCGLNLYAKSRDGTGISGCTARTRRRCSAQLVHIALQCTMMPAQMIA